MVDFSLIAEAITEYLGERCDDFNPDCQTCMAWKAYDHIAALSAENERLRKMLEWQPIETVPLDTIVDLWCTYAGAPASWGNGRPTGEIVHNRHKSKKYGWFGNQSDDGVPNGDGTDLLPVAWRWPTPDVPLELMERYIAARRALEGG